MNDALYRGIPLSSSSSLSDKGVSGANRGTFGSLLRILGASCGTMGVSLYLLLPDLDLGIVSGIIPDTPKSGVAVCPEAHVLVLKEGSDSEATNLSF